MKCQYQGLCCKGQIDGKIKYFDGKKVCSWCYWKLKQGITEENNKIKYNKKNDNN